MTDKKRIVVALSGGVDSSMAAALLKRQGHEVIGMMLRLWSEPGREGSNRCCTPDSMATARRVAAHLDIPFYVVDAKEPFRQVVVESFLEGYAQGDTPNPCLQCNRSIRWTLLLSHALAFGAQKMATGHYARVEPDAAGVLTLRRALDMAKDQSYVLHVLDQDQLGRAVFPLGQFKKTEIRKMAAEYGLPTANRADSQDLCFLGGEDYRLFLRRHRPDVLKPGRILDSSGNVRGHHTGLPNYTIGQRRGLGVQSSQPMFVIGKDAANNTLVIGPKANLGAPELEASQLHWISGQPRREPFHAMVKIRSTAVAKPAVVNPLEEGTRARVQFEAPEVGITPGQAAVFYVDDAVVGGGTIRAAM